MALGSALHRRGRRFRKDLLLRVGGIRIRPDVVFTRLRVAVFVDGCFWHCCPEHGTRPRSNTAYWVPKLRRNVERDRQVDQTLAPAGWTVVRLWEHQPTSEAVTTIEQILDTHQHRPLL